MHNYQTTGIVISRTNFGEADRIVRLITPDRGKLSAVAKGVRKIKSRSGGHLELFGEVNLVLATGRNLNVVTSASLVWYPHELAADYNRLQLAFTMATAVDRLSQPDHPAEDLYFMFKEAIQAVDSGAAGPLPELWFKIRLLNLAGYRPELTACVTCGKLDKSIEYSFSSDRGGIVCESHANATDHPISQSSIKLWRLMSDHPYATIAQITNAADLAASTLPLCNDFYEHHIGISFRPKF